MRILLAALAVTTALTGVAKAADKPVIAPAPAWVKPVAAPPAPAKPDEQPFRLLLSDQQILLEPGRQTVYSDVVLVIQTPQGLAAGNLAFPWRPDTDVLTVHKLLIRRGAEVIDVLASGQTFTVVRREQNLENATLDGVLTATMQPEGLQAGDTVEFAASIASSDPTLKGHVEQLAGAWNGFPIARAHLRVQWPTTLPVRLRQTAALPALRPIKTGNVTAVELSMDDVQPIVPPKNAPARYQIGRLIELTDYASWADLGALMAPLFEKAAAIPADGPLRAELTKIAALSPDPKARAEAALALVQDRVRYVALAMGAGGYVPADAATTWSRRYGDCKGKTALLLALLHALGIEADAVAVNALSGDGIDARLPMVGVFNHVLVRAVIAGKTYWLDGTRTGDASLDRLRVPNFGWGLPLVARGAALVRMLPPPLDVPTQDTTIRIDASAGISAPAPASVQTVFRGDDAIGARAGLASLVGEARDRALKQYWKDQYDFIEVKTATASFDAKTGEQTLAMTGEAKLDWANGNYQTDGTDVGYRADFARDPGPNSDAPIAVPYPYSNQVNETIVLPKGAGTFKLGTNMEVDQTAGGIAYHRHATIAGGVFTIEKTERSVAAEFPAKDAPAQQAALRMLADRRATVRMPSGYTQTTKDLAAVRADVPTTSTGYVSRGYVFANRGSKAEALADYDKAVALDPRNVDAWANRAITRVQAGDLAGARTDLGKAEALDPTYVQNFIGRGMLAEAEKRPRDAVAAYTEALAREPDNGFALRRRAWDYATTGDVDRALADMSSYIAKNGDDVTGYVDRAGLYTGRERFDEALADLDRAVALEPGNVLALANRSLVHVLKGERDAAARDLDAAAKIDAKNAVVFRARGLVADQKGDAEAAIADYTASLASDPADVFSLIHRAQAHHALGQDDVAMQDAAAALTQQPQALDMYLLRANILRNRGQQAEALAEAARMEAAAPGVQWAHVDAARMYAAFHRDAEAAKAYDRALAIKPEAFIYLNRGLGRPRADLAGRQADFDAALKLEPGLTAAITAKARLQMEQGDAKGAAATYSAALAKAPGDMEILLGRGIAYAKGGDAKAAEADFAVARAGAKDGLALNNQCWAKATEGVALDSALADCDAALAKVPGDFAFLDSRGLVLLRLGRFDAAIADYDRALLGLANLPTSLYGRAVAKARKGDRAGSTADAAAAVKIDPDVRAAFEGFGVTL